MLHINLRVVSTQVIVFGFKFKFFCCISFSYNIIFPIKTLPKQLNYKSDEQCGYEAPSQKKTSVLEIFLNKFKNVISGLRSGAVKLIGGSVHITNKFVQKWDRSAT
jgi:hypothetical protein